MADLGGRRRGDAVLVGAGGAGRDGANDGSARRRHRPRRCRQERLHRRCETPNFSRDILSWITDCQISTKLLHYFIVDY